jgi:hypothetical protein
MCGKIADVPDGMKLLSYGGGQTAFGDDLVNLIVQISLRRTALSFSTACKQRLLRAALALALYVRTVAASAKSWRYGSVTSAGIGRVALRG